MQGDGERYLADLARTRQLHKNILTPVRRMQIKAKADFTCAYCQRRGDLMLDPDGKRWHMDHIIPLPRALNFRTDNIALSCAACNIAKGNRTPDEWRA